MEEDFDWLGGPFKDLIVVCYNRFIQNYCNSFGYCGKLHLPDYVELINRVDHNAWNSDSYDMLNV